MSLGKLFPTLLLLSLAVDLSFQQQTVKPNYREKVELLKSQSPKYYQIDLSELPDETDLSISTASLDDSAPKIFVSKNNRIPKDLPSADYGNVNPQGGIIFIPFTELRGIEQIYLGMFCAQSRCKGEFEIEYSKEVVVAADGQLHQFKEDLHGATSAVVRLYVPDDPDIDRIIIAASALSVAPDVVPEMRLYLNRGDRIPDSNYAEVIPMSAWFESRTAVIYKGTDLFCTDCTYTVSAKFNEGASLNFQATVVESTKEITTGYFLDAIIQGKTNNYIFEPFDAEEYEDIILDVSPQIGTIEVDIRCDTDTSTQGWHFVVEKKKEDIIITPREREECIGETFQVSVTSEEPSIYTIRMVPAEENEIYLQKGVPVEGDLDPVEFVEYEMSVPLFATEKIELTITAPDDISFEMINCRIPNQCPGMSADFTKTLDLTDIVKDFTYDTENLGDNTKKIIIDPHNGGCYPLLIEQPGQHSLAVPACAYKIKLTNKGEQKAEYIMTADLQGHAMLYPSVPILMAVSADEFQYFVLDAPQETLTRVSFQLTVFSGHADIFVSRTEKYPTKRNSEGQLEHEGLVAFEKDKVGDLQGNYYVAVKAYETTSFSVTAVLLDVNGATDDFAISIEEGVPYKGVLLVTHEFPVQYYKFHLDLEDNWEGSIKISVSPLRGSLVLTAIYQTFAADPFKFDFQSTTGTLELFSKDPRFKKQGTVYIGVFVEWADPRSYSIKDIPYSINYRIQHGSGISSSPGDAPIPSNTIPIILTTQFPHHDVIKAREIMFFKVYILADDEAITLFKQADVGDVNLFVSTTYDNKFPDQSNYDFSTKDTHLSELTLEKEDLKQACKGQAKSNKLCEINFSVISATPEGEVSFTVSLFRGKHTDNPLMLEDGRQSRFNLPEKEKPAIFYFYPTPKEDTFIVVSSHNKIATIYANVREVDMDNPNGNTKELPTGVNHDFVSIKGQNAGFAHLLIPRDEDITSPVIILTVYFDDPFNSQPDTEDKNANSFKITASSHITQMHTGSPVIGHVAKASYQYYFVNVHRVDCTLVLSLTSLDDGDPDLLVSQGWLSRPTLEDHQFASISRLGTEVLKIKTADVYPKTSMEGLWMIGVYGKTESTYTLTVVYEDMNTLELTQGIPVEMYLEAGSEIYYKYLHQSDKDLDLKIEELSGDIVAYVGTLASGQQASKDTLPSATKNTDTLDPSETSSLRIQGSACPKCLYYIKLEVRQSSKFIIMMIEEQNIASITPTILYQDKLDAGASKKFMFFAKNSEEVDLNLVLKTGSLGVYISNNPLVNKTNAYWDSHLSTKVPSTILKMSKTSLNEKKIQQGVWDGKQEVLSVDDAFFFNFVNEGKTTVEFNFALMLKEASFTLKLGELQVADFDPDEKKSFLYYSPYTSGITSLDIAYCTTMSKAKNQREQDMLLSEALEGFDFLATFWSQKITAGKGEDAIPENNDLIITTIDSVENDQQRICLKQSIVLENQPEEGKYEFLLKNLYNTKMTIGIKVDTTETDYTMLDKATQSNGYIYPNSTKDFEILLPDKGVWYFTLLSCQGKFSYIVADTTEAIDITFSRPLHSDGGDAKRLTRSKMLVDEPSRKFIRIEGIETQYSDVDRIEYLIFSSFSQDDKIIDYSSDDPKWGDLYVSNLRHEFTFDYDESSLELFFHPIKLNEYAPEDTFSFYIRLCPADAVYQKDNYCTPFHPNQACVDEFQSTSITDTKERSQVFQNVPPGKYVAHVVGNVNHNGNTVFPFAYLAYEVELTEPVLYQLWDFVYYLTAGVLLLLCLACTVKKISSAKGDEDSRRQYGFVGDDEERTQTS